MEYILLIDFGSTFTKATVISKQDKEKILLVKHPSTVKRDASIALNKCLDDIEQYIGRKNLINAPIYASSSAAGGLRLSVVGLTNNLSLSAGRGVAFGAGGRIVSIFSGKLGISEIENLERGDSEVLFLCGGFENGNTSIVLHNADLIANSKINIPIIYSGNSKLSKEIRYLMSKSNKECFIAPNIIPSKNELNIEPSIEIIRNIFLERIINMKGLGNIKQTLSGNVIPTPVAVLNAGKILSLGVSNNEGLGEFILVDVGGATTDIHSYSNNYAYPGSKIIGAKELYAKRTVEGDLGMRESSINLVDEVGLDRFSNETGLCRDFILSGITKRSNNPEYLPNSNLDKDLDDYIAAYAVELAIRRHAGRLENIISSNYKYLQYGKNLTDTKIILGTGGQIINSDNAKSILSNANFDSRIDNKKTLLPKDAKIILDDDYILYAAGLLAEIDKQLSYEVLNNSIKMERG